MSDLTQAIKIISWVSAKTEWFGSFMLMKQFLEALHEAELIFSNDEFFSFRVEELRWFEITLRGDGPYGRLGGFYSGDMTRAPGYRCAIVVHEHLARLKIKMTMKHS